MRQQVPQYKNGNLLWKTIITGQVEVVAVTAYMSVGYQSQLEKSLEDVFLDSFLASSSL